MIDFVAARANMLEGQVRTSGVTRREVLHAMARIPRERFVPKSRREFAYMDDVLHVSPKRFLLPPRILAKMLQAADIEPTDTVLDVGCATGYSSAVLGAIAQSVIALEVDEALSTSATETLADLGIDNVATVTGPLADGYESQGPYDVIIVNGSIPKRSARLEAQLADGGRLVVVVRSGPMGRATVFLRSGEEVSGVPVFDATVPVLDGFAEPAGFVF